jgi:hypothetical protein
MIIQTYTDYELDVAKAIRDSLKATGEHLVIIPHTSNYAFISTEDNGELIVAIEAEDGSELDVAKGFQSLDDCREYARLVGNYAGFPDENIDSDVYEYTYFQGEFAEDENGRYHITDGENKESLSEGDCILILSEDEEWLRGNYVGKAIVCFGEEDLFRISTGSIVRKIL